MANFKSGDEIIITNVEHPDNDFYRIGDSAILSRQVNHGLWMAEFHGTDFWCVQESEIERISHTMGNSSLRRVKGELLMTLTPALWLQIKACIPAHESWMTFGGNPIAWRARENIADAFDNLLENNPDLHVFDKDCT